MHNILKLAGTLALSLVTLAHADPITGRIDIGANGSTVTIDQTANTVVFNEGAGFGTINAQVTMATGNYSIFAPTLTSDTPATYFDFNYSTPFSPANQRIWEINTNTYFTLNSITSVVENTMAVGLQGFGTAFLTGFDPTPGVWSFSADRSMGQAQFTFSSTTQATLPGDQGGPGVADGGATAALLGMSVLSLGIMRRFFDRA